MTVTWEETHGQKVVSSFWVWLACPENRVRELQVPQTKSIFPTKRMCLFLKTSQTETSKIEHKLLVQEQNDLLSWHFTASVWFLRLNNIPGKSTLQLTYRRNSLNFKPFKANYGEANTSPSSLPKQTPSLTSSSIEDSLLWVLSLPAPAFSWCDGSSHRVFLPPILNSLNMEKSTWST